MKRRYDLKTWLVATTWLCAWGCHATPNAPVSHPAGATSVSDKTTSPSAPPTSSVRPTSAPSARPSSLASAAPSIAAPIHLVAPAGGLALGGVVRVDTAYVTSTGVGKVISNAGAAAIADGTLAVDGADLDASGNLIGRDGSILATASAGAIVVPAALLSNNGGGLISDHGSGLLSNNGAGVTTGAAVGLRLLGLDDGSTGAATAVGDGDRLVPAAGMAIFAIALDTGLPIPLGTGADGQPALAVYSNARGEYALYLPAGSVGNVEVEAVVPHQTDSRLRYTSLTPTTATQPAVDLDTALEASYTQTVTTNVMQYLITHDPATNSATLNPGANSAAIASLTSAALVTVDAAAQQGHVTSLPAARQRALAAKLADLLIGSTDLTVDVDGLTYAEPGYEGLVSYAAFAKTLHARREQIAGRFAALRAQGQDPEKYFNALPEVAASKQADGSVYDIKRPADFMAWVLTAGLPPTLETTPTEAALEADYLQAGLTAGDLPFLWDADLIATVSENMIDTLFLNPANQAKVLDWISNPS